MQILEQIRGYIRSQALLEPKQRLVVAVSGGADSLCLMDCLHRLGYQLVVAHLDHGLRPESSMEAAQVGQIAETMGLQFVTKRIEVADRSAGRSLEEAARMLRYQFLAESAQSAGLDTIAVGHTGDDQVETVLMHLLRGAGPAGLKGMLPRTRLDQWVGIEAVAPAYLVRPLLGLTRSQTIEYCERRGLRPIQDPSNLDLNLHRNRLRHELLPALESYNPAVRQVLLRTAQVMAAESDLTAQLVEAAWRAMVRQVGPAALAFDKAALGSQHIAIQRALIRRAVWQLKPGLRDVGFDAVEATLELVRSGSTARRTTTGGIDCLSLGPELVLRLPGSSISFPAYPQLTSAAASALGPSQALPLAEGWRLTMGALTAHARGEELDRDPHTAIFDAEGMPTTLMVRAPQPGDRLRPLGMRGSVKLADLFVNCGIPWPARQLWPLVTAGDELLWVVGLRMAHRHRVTPDTTSTLCLRLLRPVSGDGPPPI